MPASAGSLGGVSFREQAQRWSVKPAIGIGLHPPCQNTPQELSRTVTGCFAVAPLPLGAQFLERHRGDTLHSTCNALANGVSLAHHLDEVAALFAALVADDVMTRLSQAGKRCTGRCD